MDITNKAEFIYFMQRACEDQDNDCYIELYNILLRAFIAADCDFDGQVWRTNTKSPNTKYKSTFTPYVDSLPPCPPGLRG
jgi:hypothetical protein